MKVVRVVGLCARPLQERYLAASPAERGRLDEVIEREQHWIVERMAAKGYQLEGTVCGVLGIFTRGPARGAIRVLQPEAQGV